MIIFFLNIILTLLSFYSERLGELPIKPSNNLKRARSRAVVFVRCCHLGVDGRSKCMLPYLKLCPSLFGQRSHLF